MRGVALVIGLVSTTASAVCPVVDTEIDGAPNSLRACLVAARGMPTRQVITFSAGVSVVQLSSPLLLDASPGVELDGSGHPVVIDGSGLGSSDFVLDVRVGNCRVHDLEVRPGPGPVAAGIRVARGVSGTMLERLDVSNGPGSGVQLEGDDFGTAIAQCRFSNLGNCGIDWLADSVACTARSTISGNTLDTISPTRSCGGIQLVGTGCVDVLDNVLIDTGNINLKLTLNAHTNVLSGNRITGGHVGIGVYNGANDNVISFNTLTGVEDEGISMGDIGTVDNVVAGNVVRGTLRGAGGSGWGIHLFRGAQRTGVFHNTVFQSESSGFVIEDPMVVALQNNLSVWNDGVGFDLNPDAGVTFGGNLAFSNDAGNFGARVDPSARSCEPNLDSAGRPACSACVVDRGVDLGADQPDLTPASDSLNFYGAAPDPGAVELSCSPLPDGGFTSSDGGLASGSDGGGASRRIATVGCACGTGMTAPWQLAALTLAWRCARRRSPTPRRNGDLLDVRRD